MNLQIREAAKVFSKEALILMRKTVRRLDLQGLSLIMQEFRHSCALKDFFIILNYVPNREIFRTALKELMIETLVRIQHRNEGRQHFIDEIKMRFAYLIDSMALFE